MSHPSRRSVTVLGLVGLAGSLAGCGEMPTLGSLGAGPVGEAPPAERRRYARSPEYDRVYGAIEGEQFAIPAFDYTVMDPETLRRRVRYASAEAPGTIVIETRNHAMYYIEGNGQATRYGVGVGREGFAWNGDAKVAVRKSWPDWVPPREMIARDPAVAAQLTETPRGRGVPGGPKSPLGARAMVLAANGHDSGYRIHGTWEPETIGSNVSSGCIRLINQDIVHLYGRTTQGNRVVVA